ncbi:hypothetical protein [Butyrivibrio sp. VCB2006]|uniref:hypothetical protein n=1 Tax=Butyrivibrio sp. VCB2006 TaxID=1280679 RepID=UPI000411C1CD|nr:hypothetical protein [Butyrivibrio sp. VCB2006]
MNKDIVPEHFTLELALFDMVPVILFGVASLILWNSVGGVVLFLGAVICFVSGMLKVLWKIIVVLKKKNVWPLFLQMRIGMPIGFAFLIIGLIIAGVKGNLSAFAAGLLHPLPMIFLVLTVIAMTGMIYCGRKLNSADVKANWIEQICNTVGQGSFMMMVIMASSL